MNQDSQSPLYSIRIPVFRSKKILEKTISNALSLYENEGPMVELFRVHDRSPNDSWDILEQTALLAYRKDEGVGAVFHHISLHQRGFFKEKHDERQLTNTERFNDCLVRLPFHLHSNDTDVTYIVDRIKGFYTSQ